MATYYVRKSGNDANDGLSPATAFATIGKAASVVQAGDTVYIGAGVYREKPILTTAGTSTAPIRWIGDVDGKETGDAGLVIVTAFDADQGAPARDHGWNIQADYNELYYLVIVGGTGDALLIAIPGVDHNWQGIVVKYCCLIIAGDARESAPSSCINMDFRGGWQAGSSVTVVNNILIGGEFFMRLTDGQTTAVDANIRIEGNVFLGQIRTGIYVYVYALTATGTIPGGIRINNNTFIGGKRGIRIGAQVNSTTEIFVENNIFAQVGTIFYHDASSGTNPIRADNNVFINYDNLYIGTAPTLGTNNKDGVGAAVMAALADHPLWAKMGWSPYKPFAPIITVDDQKVGWVDTGASSPTYTGGLGNSFGNNELHGDNRVMVRGRDHGAAEVSAIPKEETTTVQTGSGVRFEGAGFHDFYVPVDAVQTTISVWARYDANYSGSLPRLLVTNIPGVADQEAVMTAAANTWEQLSVTFTPSRKATVRVRIESRDTSANGLCYFDSLEVS